MQNKARIPWTYIVPVIVIGAIILGIVYYQASSNASSILTTKPGNYQFPFACTGASTLYVHIHPWLRIVISGRNITIPADIGVIPNCDQPVHTHDASGIIHIESPDAQNYTLGEFFQIWAATFSYAVINNTKAPIVFNSTDILGFRAGGSHAVTLLVDGKTSSAFGSLVLNSLDYCNSSNSVATSSPCYSTAQGNPYYFGGYPYGKGHTIVIEYS